MDTVYVGNDRFAELMEYARVNNISVAVLSPISKDVSWAPVLSRAPASFTSFGLTQAAF